MNCFYSRILTDGEPPHLFVDSNIYIDLWTKELIHTAQFFYLMEIVVFLVFVFHVDLEWKLDSFHGKEDNLFSIGKCFIFGSVLDSGQCGLFQYVMGIIVYNYCALVLLQAFDNFSGRFCSLSRVGRGGSVLLCTVVRALVQEKEEPATISSFAKIDSILLLHIFP